MSVVATVKVYDGIVLGAESMTQITGVISGQQQLVKAYENAQKLFRVADLPIGILTYGIGNIGRRSIESFVHEFSRSEKDRSQQPGQRVSVEETAGRFFSFMHGHHTQAFGTMAAAEQPRLGFIVAGYSDGDQEYLASEWEFILPHHQAPIAVRPQTEIGASWRGVTGPFARLMFGVDPVFESQMAQAGATPQELVRFKQVAAGLATNVIFDGMPLRDAVGYCRFVIHTTIGWCTYALGSAACGGPIRLATITPGSGFEWVTPPKNYVEGEKHEQH
jgi:hypothetical protein